MIAGIILLIGGFSWLLIETRYLTARLLVGAPALPIMPPEPVRINKSALIHRFDLKSYIDPLCGWQWLHDNQDFTFETTLEFIFSGVKHTMNIKDPSILKLVMKAITQKHKPVNMVYPPSHYKQYMSGTRRI